MSTTIHRTKRALVFAAATGLLLTACTSGDGDDDATDEASGSDSESSESGEASGDAVTITLTTNAITGGKNAAEADWIATG